MGKTSLLSCRTLWSRFVLFGLALLALLAGRVSPAAAQVPINPPNHAGFPKIINGAGTVVASQPVMADLGLTPGFNQIIFGTRQGDLYVLQHQNDGSWAPAPGWPQHLGAHVASSPAIGDLDGDGDLEIVVGYGSTFDTTHDGGVAAFKADGTRMWTVTTAAILSWTHAPVQGTPAIGDVDGDGKMEVAFGSLDQHIYLVDGTTGANKPGWPVDAHDTVFSSPALYDIDGDGLPDIIIGTDAHFEGPPINTPNGGVLQVLRFDGSPVAGFPKYFDQVISSSPVVADIDGDGRPEIIFGTGNFWGPNSTPMTTPVHQVYALHCDGSPVAGWPVHVDGQVDTTPALADLNGDGHLEVIVTDDNTGPSNNFHVYAIKFDGTVLWSAVPKDFFGTNPALSAGQPVVGDVLGDSHLEVLVPTNGEIAVFSSTGVQLTQGGPPYTNQKVSFGADTSLDNVFVGDLETNHADGKIEVLAISATPFPSAANLEVFAWNPVNSDNAAPWGMFRHTIDRVGIAPAAGGCRGACVADTTARSFFAIAPCRVVDTRQANGSYGTPPLANGTLRDFVMTSQCGVSSSAHAVSVNVTVVNGTGAGNLRFSPGCTPPQTSTINWSAGQTRANNAILSLDANGHLTVAPSVAGGGTVNLVIDVNGYFQ
jgi:hypothetical protein